MGGCITSDFKGRARLRPTGRSGNALLCKVLLGVFDMGKRSDRYDVDIPDSHVWKEVEPTLWECIYCHGFAVSTSTPDCEHDAVHEAKARELLNT